MNQSLKMLLRDWRAGELRVLAMALVVAVASITSVAFFADRVGRALVRDAHQLLGADLVLVSDHPWQAGIAEEIARRGLEHARATTFISMAIAGENSVLAGVKAVSANYPLRGRLRIAPAVNAPDAPAPVMAALEGEYARAGLALSANATEPPDHVTVTLDFMAHLCAVEADAWQRRHSAMAVAQLDREAGFLQRYLGPWLPAFARLVAARDPDGFYARVTETAGTLAVHDLDIVTALAARSREAERR